MICPHTRYKKYPHAKNTSIFDLDVSFVQLCSFFHVSVVVLFSIVSFKLYCSKTFCCWCRMCMLFHSSKLQCVWQFGNCHWFEFRSVNEVLFAKECELVNNNQKSNFLQVKFAINFHKCSRIQLIWCTIWWALTTVIKAELNNNLDTFKIWRVQAGCWIRFYCMAWNQINLNHSDSTIITFKKNVSSNIFANSSRHKSNSPKVWLQFSCWSI